MKLLYFQVVFDEVLAGTEIPRGAGRPKLYVYLTLHCRHQNDFVVKIGSGRNDT